MRNSRRRHDSSRSRVLVALFRYGPMNGPKLSLRIGEFDCYSAIEALRKQGLVARPRRSGPYELTDAGREEARRMIAAEHVRRVQDIQWALRSGSS